MVRLIPGITKQSIIKKRRARLATVNAVAMPKSLLARVQAFVDMVDIGDWVAYVEVDNRDPKGEAVLVIAQVMRFSDPNNPNSMDVREAMFRTADGKTHKYKKIKTIALSDACDECLKIPCGKGKYSKPENYVKLVESGGRWRPSLTGDLGYAKIAYDDESDDDREEAELEEREIAQQRERDRDNIFTEEEEVDSDGNVYRVQRPADRSSRDRDRSVMAGLTPAQRRHVRDLMKRRKWSRHRALQEILREDDGGPDEDEDDEF